MVSQQGSCALILQNRQCKYFPQHSFCATSHHFSKYPGKYTGSSIFSNLKRRSAYQQPLFLNLHVPCAHANRISESEGNKYLPTSTLSGGKIFPTNNTSRRDLYRVGMHGCQYKSVDQQRNNGEGGRRGEGGDGTRREGSQRKTGES